MSTMMVDVSSPFSFKRRRILGNFDHTASPKPKFGREIQVFEESNADESSDESYELTADDYYRILSTRKGEKFLITHKMRATEEDERRSRLTKAVIRVRFPDGHTLEATFHPSDKIQSLVDFIKKVDARPELTFYLFTTPPKKVIKDMSQDFYSAGLAPAAVVYLSYGITN